MTPSMSFEEAKNLVKDRADLGAIISRHTKAVKTATGFKACCPLPGHKEKTPSFHFNAGKNYFFCYGCNRGGDVFKFLEWVEGIPFMEALKELAAQLHVELPKARALSPEQKQQVEVDKSHRDLGFDLMDRANKFFSRVLADGATPGALDGQEYLKKRGITAAEIAELNLGWAPENGDALTRKLSAKELPIAIECGLSREFDQRRADFFRNRLMIPIADVRGRTIGFSGRTLTEVTGKNPKYINSSESEWFKKKSVVYGLDRAAKFIRVEGYVCVVEGYFDQWAFQRHEIPAVAVMGTALTEEHSALIARYTKQVVLVMDSDAAGVASTKKSLPLLFERDFNVRVFSAFGGKDPHEWLSSLSGEISDVKQKLQAAPEGLEWLGRIALKEVTDSKLNRLQVFQKMKDVWMLARSQAQKNLLADEIAQVLGLDRDVVKESLQDLAARSPAGPDNRTSRGPSQQDRSVHGGFARAPQFAHAGSVASGTSSDSRRASRVPNLATSPRDRAAEEAFVWWLWHWDVLAPQSDKVWRHRVEVFQGTPASECLEHIAALAQKSGSLPQISAFAEWMDSHPESEIVRRWILKGFVVPDTGMSGDSSKVLISFEEFLSSLNREGVRAEILRLQSEMRGLKADADATARLLKRVQDLSLSLEKRK